MDRIWITNGSTRVAPVTNPFIAACEEGFVPTHIHILDNPVIADITDEVTALMRTTVEAFGEPEPEISVETIDEETDFDAIIAYLQSAMEGTGETEVAVDVTPGRKYWSIISFRAGLEYDADHLYYIHVKSGEFFGESYPTIPRPAVDLIDFTEVV